MTARSRALARISALPSIWRIVLGLQPMYIIEVIDRNFNKLSSEDKVKVLIHEITPHTQRLYWWPQTTR